MTRKLISAMLYAAFALGANPVLADPLDITAIAALRAGDMQKLVFHSEPKEMAKIGFFDEAGNDVSLDAYKGKVVLLNLWATWCPPCRAEMPSIDALQRELGSENFEVVTIATGRNTIPAINKFFTEANITSLPILLDPKMAFARANGAFGLPITIILNSDGQEIARMQGDADWHGEDALTVLRALLPEETES